jgi:integrase
MAAAPPHMRLWLLLCSDLALRSGTAISIGPDHYNSHTGVLTFTTKYNEHLTLPATQAIREIIATCSMDASQSFVRQLWQTHHAANRSTGHCTTLTADALRHSYTRLRKRLGITRKLVPHDFRRTAAVAIYEHTRDMRDAQALLGHLNLASTFWYLDHNVRPVKRSTLELIKSPAWRKEQSA